jgi:hypothetical protein
LANDYAGSRAITLDRSWLATAGRYQAMADAYLAGQDEGIVAGWSTTAARYQAMADAYLNKGILTGWEATAARYQALAEYYQAVDR